MTSATRMDQSAVTQHAAAFFDAFVVAFQTFDDHRIAQRYAAPYLALNADGNLQSFGDHAEIARYFHGIVRTYHTQGCRGCRYQDLEVVPLGAQSALATVTWELLREDGSVLSSWRESYILIRKNNELCICASVDHVE